MSRNIFALNRNKILVTHKQRNDLQAPFELSGGILVYRVVKVATFKTWFSNLICFKLPNYFMLFKREITLTIEKKSEEKLLKVLKTLIFESHENLNRWFRIETSISHGRCQVIGHCSKFWTRTSENKKMNDKKRVFCVPSWMVRMEVSMEVSMEVTSILQAINCVYTLAFNLQAKCFLLHWQKVFFIFKMDGNTWSRYLSSWSQANKAKEKFCSKFKSA